MSISDLFRLDDQVAIVTGGSSGLGVAFAHALAESGADVVIAARRADRLREVQASVARTGRRCVAVEADVADPQACGAVVRRALEELGRVDILVNNAGVGTAAPATRESPTDFQRVIDVNLSGSYYMAQACGRVMGPGSSVVNVSSIVGLLHAGLPQAAYSASKAGLIGMTRDLAAQWGVRKGIRVNALVPGFFVTEISDAYRPGYLDSQVQRTLLGRTGELEELAATLVWLVGPAAGYVTGQSIVVDGGRSAT